MMEHMSNATSKSLSLTIAAVAAVAILLTIAIFPAAGMAGIAQYRHRSIAYAQQQQPSPQATNASASAGNTATNAITVVISSGASVNQTNQYFVPNSVQVPSGSNVTWINNDTAAHTATAGNPKQGPSGQFDTGLFNPGANASVTIQDQPGATIPYYCTVHPWMIATVTVVAPGQDMAAASPTANTTAPQ